MTMPAGVYYIGDLCYVMEEDWDEVCSILFAGQPNGGVNNGDFTLKDGRRFATYSTKYGDGRYGTSTGGVCAVDSGMVGCILKSDIKEDIPYGLCTIETFVTDFETSGEKFIGNEYNGAWDGIIKFGHLYVYTGFEDDDDPFDPFYDEDDYEQSDSAQKDY